MTTREIKADFDELKEFARKYSIAESTDVESFVDKLRVGHRRLFALLTFIAEIEISNDKSNSYSKQSLAYFAECGSDASQAVFCWLHGAYKPANLALRSSIETFIKAAVGTEDPSVLKQKSMYELLDLAKASNTCSGLAKPHFGKIKACYGSLCGIAHSATADKFTQVNALRMFPKFEETDANDFMTEFNSVIDRYLAVLIVANRELLANMHYKNRQNILNALPQAIKQSIFVADEN